MNCRDCGILLIGETGWCRKCVRKRSRPKCKTCGEHLNFYGQCTTCNVDDLREINYTPTLKQIAASCAEIRDEWSELEEERRKCAGRNPAVEYRPMFVRRGDGPYRE
jgi:hypothetical protein